MPSFYQADLFRALVRTSKVDLRVIFENKISEDRAKLGWQDDLEGFEHEFLDDQHPLSDALRKVRKYRSQVHIVNGLWAGKVTEAVLLTLFLSRSKYLIYSEAPDPRYVPSLFKNKTLMVVGKPIVRNAAGLLPISHFATDYFKSYGACDPRLHRFGYFRSLPTDFNVRSKAKKDETVNVVFVGQLVHRKGVDTLLSGMEPLFGDYQDLRLQLIGSGDLEGQLRNWVEERNLSRYVTFEGAIDPRKVIDRISEASLLVLPSRWDGWGLVVNEALMAGVPVIVSDMCGAADIVHDGTNGYVFHSENVEDLKRKLELFLGSTTSREMMGKKAKDIGTNLDAENAAKYLVDIFEEHDVKEEDMSRYPWVVNQSRWL